MPHRAPPLSAGFQELYSNKAKVEEWMDEVSTTQVFTQRESSRLPGKQKQRPLTAVPCGSSQPWNAFRGQKHPRSAYPRLSQHAIPPLAPPEARGMDAVPPDIITDLEAIGGDDWPVAKGPSIIILPHAGPAMNGEYHTQQHQPSTPPLQLFGRSSPRMIQVLLEVNQFEAPLAAFQVKSPRQDAEDAAVGVEDEPDTYPGASAMPNFEAEVYVATLRSILDNKDAMRDYSPSGDSAVDAHLPPIWSGTTSSTQRQRFGEQNIFQDGSPRTHHRPLSSKLIRHQGGIHLEAGRRGLRTFRKCEAGCRSRQRIFQEIAVQPVGPILQYQ